MQDLPTQQVLMMNKLKDLCLPRTFENDSDVQDITDLIQNCINPQHFFETNYKTQGMDVLFNTVLKGSKGKVTNNLSN